jgi:hypothetical protein
MQIKDIEKVVDIAYTALFVVVVTIVFIALYLGG